MYYIALTSPGAKSKQEDTTGRACRSPTLLSDIKASNNATLRVSILSGTDSKGSNGASVKAPKTNARSQEELATRRSSTTQELRH